ncbi:MAG: universal stress protein [Nocardioides sp.]
MTATTGFTTGTVETSTGPWARAHGPVVVAVDGSERNRAAVAWAATEAGRLGVQLVLVTAVDDSALPVPHWRLHDAAAHARTLLASVAEDVGPAVGGADNVSQQVVEGYPEDVLLSRFPDAGLIVVGKRGLGSMSRLLVGSTSLSVAGRSKVDVVVVPDGWRRTAHEHRPIVVGLDPYRPHEQLLDQAFRRAAALEVPVVVVDGWETPVSAAWGATAAAGVPMVPVADWEREAHAEADAVIAEWKHRYPEVEVRTLHAHTHPATAVLDAAEDAQLVLLGRHTEHRLAGFGFGSVTRAVLHYAECPVAVVPTDHD